MSFLLDTHVIIWYLQDDAQLPPRISDLLENTENQLLVSMASLWEMAIKINLGKLNLTITFSEFPQLLEQYSIEILPITVIRALPTVALAPSGSL